MTEARHEKTAGPVIDRQRTPDLWIHSQAINGLGYLVQEFTAETTPR